MHKYHLSNIFMPKFIRTLDTNKWRAGCRDTFKHSLNLKVFEKNSTTSTATNDGGDYYCLLVIYISQLQSEIDCM